MAAHFILGTAGHVDHGKSALVKALTGTDPDRLPEEKARGITIDLGFAHVELTDPGPPPSSIHLGIVDVPGHEDFVKNMVAGVGSIDLALLVVAADDGWMPQTEEHLQILQYLGVRRAVVALTKIDLAPEDAVGAITSVREHLRGTAMAEAPVVPTSIISGQGLDALKAALVQVLSSTPLPRDLGKPRLPIDRVFTLRGVGTVVTGTLVGGAFHRGQAVVVQPGGSLTRIRTLQSHNHESDKLGPGARVALSLADLSVAGKNTGLGAEGVRRGQVVTLNELGKATKTLDVLLERTDRPDPAKAAAARPLKDGLRVRVHHGSGNTGARMVLLDQKDIAPGESGIAELRLDRPLFALAGDRFIVRDWAEQRTLAGGTVLDAEANPRFFRSAAQRSFLKTRAASPHSVEVALESLLARDHVVRRADLLVQASFSSDEIADAVLRLEGGGKARTAGELVMQSAWWEGIRRQAMRAVDAQHQAHPEQPGLPLIQLRASLEADLGRPEVFDLLVMDLLKGGILKAGTVLKRAAHRPALPPPLQAAGTLLRNTLSARPFDPPSRKELAPTPAAQQALRFLIQTGEAVELGPDVVLLAENFARAVDQVKRHLEEQRSATVSELRQVIGATRRIVVPLLEKLDREGVTRRVGDLRALRLGR